MTSRIAPRALAACALLAACSSSSNPAADAAAERGPSLDGRGELRVDVGLYPNKPKGNPLVPEVAAYPFPSDFYTVKDPGSPTGRRLSLPKEVLPKSITPEVFKDADGFSRIPVILTQLPGGVDPKSLPDPADPAATTDKASAPVLLVEEGSGNLVPILVENDLAAQNVEERSLIIRPLRTLAGGTGHVVIVRSKLRDLAGKPHAPGNAYRALRDGIPTTVPELEAQREDFKRVKSAIEKLGLDPAEVVQAWPFTTRSEASVQQALLSMQAQANAAPLASYKILSDVVEEKDGKKNRQIKASFVGPSFIGADKRVHLDASGKAVQQGTREVEFGLTIPSTIDGPRPVILFGHGFLGSWAQGTRGSFNDLCTESRFSAAMSYFGFNETLQAYLVEALTTNMGAFEYVVAEVQQTFANYTTMARLVKEKLADELTGTGPGGSFKLLDPKQVHYLGISNGGTFGFVVAATSPQLTRACLVVGGGGLVHFLQRSVVWNGYKGLFAIVYHDARDQQLMMSLMQIVIDPIDSMNYVEHLAKDRFPGCQPLRAAMIMAVNDSQVHNLVSEWVARTAKIPLVTPSPKSIFGLQTLAAPPPDGTTADAALLVFDEKVEGYPAGNVPPATDNGTHGTVTKLPGYKKSVSDFIEHGKLVQHCDGACDPN